MLEDLKKQVCESYLEMENKGFLALKRGSISAIDRTTGNVVIVSREDNTAPEYISVINSEGALLEGKKPAFDYETHLELYKIYEDIDNILFTQSGYTMVWAQMRERIRPFSTYHTQYFRGEIQYTEVLPEDVSDKNYDKSVAKAIKRAMKARNTVDMPGILVAQHGAYTWGKTLKQVTEVAAALEEITKSAWHMASISGLNMNQIPFWVQEAKFAEAKQE
ncbi:class II aldolase/adducin family protein [Konateibacter massiliensis]|uniref:class II aldolase/adducin family protein n=1 Tax=Konateibacter massiliensis TaxID=2002841 RepID=UPI000C145CE9|nr:class II aldolase/adducin family protein [Konateibacter massiliensis]